ncbi:MAG: tetratricopeptide repeat protein, partial [Candidatus Acidiferrum sp.]
MDAAMADVDRAYQEFNHKDEVWGWRFRVLKAQIFVYRKEYKKALALLHEELPPSLASTEVAVRKNMVEGIAYRVGQQFANSEEKFAVARGLAESLRSKLLSEVLNNQGALEIDEKKYSDAEASYRRALSLSREVGYPAQTASALMNLARVATKQERFDEALDWNQEALTLARSLGMKATVTTIIGNMAWSYAELGDHENALPLYQQAAEESERDKLPSLQAYWLSGVSDSYISEHNYQAAETVLTRALKIARALDEKSALTQCLNDLS